MLPAEREEVSRTRHDISGAETGKPGKRLPVSVYRTGETEREGTNASSEHTPGSAGRTPPPRCVHKAVPAEDYKSIIEFAERMSCISRRKLPSFGAGNDERRFSSLTDDGQVDFGVSRGRLLEVHPAAVRAAVLVLHVLDHQPGRVVVRPEEGPAGEDALVRPVLRILQRL